MLENHISFMVSIPGFDLVEATVWTNIVATYSDAATNHLGACT